MTEEEIVKIYMKCSNKNPEGIYPVEIDIIEFGNAIEQYLVKAKRANESERRIVVPSFIDFNK